MWGKRTCANTTRRRTRDCGGTPPASGLRPVLMTRHAARQRAFTSWGHDPAHSTTQAASSGPSLLLSLLHSDRMPQLCCNGVDAHADAYDELKNSRQAAGRVQGWGVTGATAAQRRRCPQPRPSNQCCDCKGIQTRHQSSFNQTARARRKGLGAPPGSAGRQAQPSEGFAGALGHGSSSHCRQQAARSASLQVLSPPRGASQVREWRACLRARGRRQRT